MKKKIISGLVVVVVIVLLALPKYNLFFPGSKEGSATGPVRGAGVLQVEGIVISPEKLDNKLIVTGSILANESLEIKSEAAGKITGIYFKEGEAVKKGKLLVQINDKEMRAQLEKQRYNKKLYEDIETRQKKLLEKEAISQEEYENALNQFNTSSSDIKLLEAQLEKTSITAPFDGVIGLRNVSEGAYITPATVIATLYNISPAKIEFSIPGRYSTQITPGRPIFFMAENDSTQFHGKVYAIEPQIEKETRTLKIRAYAANDSRRLLPGQFVRVEFVLQTTNNALMVPSESIIPVLEGHKVMIVRKGKATESKVEIGLRTDRQVEILSGVSIGDTVLTTGLLQLKPGMGVEVVSLIQGNLTE